MTWTIWTALGVSGAAVLAALVFLAVRVLQGWRTFKRFRRHLARELARVVEAAERTAEGVEHAADTTRLDTSLGSLRTTLARAAVLRQTFEEATGAITRVTSLYPRK
jgi:hypothetical protein